MYDKVGMRPTSALPCSDDPVAAPFRLLIADDEEANLERARGFLSDRKLLVETAPGGRRALERIRRDAFDLILIDPGTRDAEARSVLRGIRSADPHVTVLVMSSSWALKPPSDPLLETADELLTKPLSRGALAAALDRFQEKKRLVEGCRALGRRIASLAAGAGLITRSDRMREILALVAKIAPLSSTVLIQGESGTGKELIARAIHHQSPRAGKPFVALNCGAVHCNLLETELFGHERGAFTGAETRKPGHIEVADGGSLFLDEIGEMSLDLQVKLLRVLQEQSFHRVGGTREVFSDLRVIASTNRNLAEEVGQKRFRSDLYYRINVVRITLPPLRERPEDIVPLAEHYVRKYCARFSRELKGISAAAMDLLQKHRWEGNVRELQNAIERAVAVADGKEIRVADLPEELLRAGDGSPADLQAKPFQAAKQEFEIRYLENMLRRTEGNIALASRLMAIPRQNLYIKMKKYRIDRSCYTRCLRRIEPLHGTAV